MRSNKEKFISNVKVIVECFLLSLIIATPVIMLKLLDEHEENNAVKRCGSKQNIVMKYTSQGDKYYECIED